MTGSRWISIGLAGGLLALVVACTGGTPTPVADGPRVAPDFALQDLDGNTVKLSDSAGQIRIVDFWATWCPPCLEEIPMYKEIHEEYGSKGVRILGVSLDDEGAEQVRPFAEQNQIPYTLLVGEDAQEVADEFGAPGLPTTYVIDGQGRIAWSATGVKPKRVLIEKIESLLASTSGA